MNEYFLIIWGYFKKHYLSIIALTISICSLILLIVLISSQWNSRAVDESDSVLESNLEETQDEDIPEIIRVDVKGEVNSPGVYELNKGHIVLDAINMAGGLTKKANTSDLNLSKELINEMVIIVSSKDTIKSNQTSSGSISASNITTTKTNGKVSINTATISELMTLSGIGEAKAKSIISYRETNGNFKTIEDIKNVSGIGEAVFAKIKENITT